MPTAVFVAFVEIVYEYYQSRSGLAASSLGTAVVGSAMYIALEKDAESMIRS